MATLVRHFGKIVKGRKIYNNQLLYNQQLLQLEGKEFEEVIKERTKRVTLDQFAFYRGAILPTCYSSELFSHYDNYDQIHEEYFVEKFLTYKVLITNFDGTKSEKTKYKSLSELNRKEMSAFIERVLIDCDLNGITVLSPEEYHNQKYNL